MLSSWVVAHFSKSQSVFIRLFEIPEIVGPAVALCASATHG